MNQEKVKQIAKELGMNEIGFTKTSQIQFDPKYRKFCEDNVCGNYGKNYACPPDCGTVEEMKERVLKYENAMLMQSCFVCKDFNDAKELKEYKIEHIRRMDALLEKTTGDISDNLVVSASCCSICKTCTKTENKPCRYPDKVRSCLSAYCINAAELAKSCNMTYWFGNNTVSYFSIFLYN